MTKLIKNFFLLLIPVLAVLVVSCDDDDTAVLTEPKLQAAEPFEAFPGTEIVVTGANLANVTELKFGDMAVTDFTNSETSITFVVPESATPGPHKIWATTPQGADYVPFNVLDEDAGGVEISYYIYQDGLAEAWEQWGGWGTTSQDFANSEDTHNESGSAIKVVYKADGWGAIQLHPGASVASLEGYTTLIAHIKAAPGSGGKPMFVFIKDLNGTEGPKFLLEGITEDAYTPFEIPLSALGNPANINELNFQTNVAESITVYIDDIGLR